MGATGITSIILIVINVIVSYRGFKNPAFFDRYKFEVDKITLNKDYKRLVTSGFLHVNWMHLIFNVFALYFFSQMVEALLGETEFLIIYFGSLIAGNLFSLIVHKKDGYYSVVGASGAVCGLIFACIALAPNSSMTLIVIPLRIWIFGLLFVATSIYGVRSRRDNVGHEAHMAGALAGMFITAIFSPMAFIENWPYILIVALPCIAFIYVIIKRPDLLLVDNLFFKTENYNYTVDQRYNLQKIDKQKEIDRILDKINRSGMKSLTSKEKQDLKEYSKIAQ